MEVYTEKKTTGFQGFMFQNFMALRITAVSPTPTMVVDGIETNDHP